MSQSSQPLFRPEAIAHKQRSLFGEINLAQPSYFSFWLFSAAFMLAMFFGFALFSELARKERVRGLLVPDQDYSRHRSECRKNRVNSYATGAEGWLR